MRGRGLVHVRAPVPASHAPDDARLVTRMPAAKRLALPDAPPATRRADARDQASRTWPSRRTTGGSTDHGKLIQSSVRFHTYSHLTSDCGFS